MARLACLVEAPPVPILSMLLPLETCVFLLSNIVCDVESETVNFAHFNTIADISQNYLVIRFNLTPSHHNLH